MTVHFVSFFLIKDWLLLLLFYNFSYLFVYGCAGPPLLHVGFLQLQHTVATL